MALVGPRSPSSDCRQEGRIYKPRRRWEHCWSYIALWALAASHTCPTSIQLNLYAENESEATPRSHRNTGRMRTNSKQHRHTTNTPTLTEKHRNSRHRRSTSNNRARCRCGVIKWSEVIAGNAACENTSRLKQRLSTVRAPTSLFPWPVQNFQIF